MIEIEVGKKYLISSAIKKTLVEREFYKNDNGKELAVEVVWRSGSFFVLVNKEEEKENLKECMKIGGKHWIYSNFSDVELDSTFDGQSEDLIFDKSWSDEEREELEERWELNLDDEEFLSMNEFLGELGFESVNTDWLIDGEIMVEEC